MRQKTKVTLNFVHRALDFLYLDYKPPDPLGVLISPEILSRYQRVFAFMLRMLRGKECCIKKCMTSHSTDS